MKSKKNRIEGPPNSFKKANPWNPPRLIRYGSLNQITTQDGGGACYDVSKSSLNDCEIAYPDMCICNS